MDAQGREGNPGGTFVGPSGIVSKWDAERTGRMWGVGGVEARARDWGSRWLRGLEHIVAAGSA